MANVTLRNICKSYPNGFNAAKNVSFEVKDKEFIVLVGPSGCGKSTTLRMIAGLEYISSGELYIDGQLVNDVEPKDRNIAMVFQNYALYPHLTVYENMAFALKLKKEKKEIIDNKVKEAAKILDLETLLDKKPKTLSGGQSQRVALGRAIVRNPKVFLMDEPLSNLDAKLRNTMRSEITKLHKQLGTTFIYVTHDQIEAMTMADRIVVMKDGVIQQIDTPQNIYSAPNNTFVAGFIGAPQMNFIDVSLVEEDNILYARNNNVDIKLNKDSYNSLDNYIGKNVVLGIRPEDIHIEEAFLSQNIDSSFECSVDITENMGAEIYAHLNLGNQIITARFDGKYVLKNNEKLKLTMDKNKIHIFDKETTLSIK